MYRSYTINWFPSSKKSWLTFTASRKETARLWNNLVKIHKRIRRLYWKWPDHNRWCRWAKGKYPGLNAQSVQQTILEFTEALKATTELRKKGDLEARYPHK